MAPHQLFKASRCVDVSLDRRQCWASGLESRQCWASGRSSLWALFEDIERKWSASDAQPFDRNWHIPTHTFCQSVTFHPNTPCNVCRWVTLPFTPQVYKTFSFSTPDWPDIDLWIHHMQNSAPSWITRVRHLESSFASFATTRPRSICTCPSIQFQAKLVAWSCESLDVSFIVSLSLCLES